MRQSLSLLLSVVLVVTLSLQMSDIAFSQSGGNIKVTDLRTEYTENPLGIDVEKPRLSWKLESSEQGQYQTAYRIQVASSKGKLLEDNPDIWDTEKVESDQSVNIEYGGEALESGKRYFWRVKVWDKHGSTSEWSEPAWWEMGLLHKSHWQAEWIGPHYDKNPAYDWTDYTIELDFTVKQDAAGIVFRGQDAHNFYMWQINTKLGPIKLRPHVQKNGQWQILKEIPLTDVIAPGEEHNQHHLKIEAYGNEIKTYINDTLVDITHDDTFSSGTIGFRSGEATEHGLYDNVHVYNQNGETLFEDDFSDADVLNFEGGTIRDGQLEVRNYAVPLYGEKTVADDDSPLMRKEFQVEKEVKRARAYVYGLGWYELHLNGEKVGDRVLTPANTVYTQRNLYDTYDVTDYLNEGENAVGLWLGNGYNEHYSQWGWRWENTKRAIVQLNIEFTDGSSTSVVTDGSWRTTSESPIVYNDMYNGETYDARKEQTGWSEPGYDDSDWESVVMAELPSDTLKSNMMPPVKVVDTIKPVKMTEPQPGVYVFDMGQVISGWTRLRVEGPAGQRVQLRHSVNIDKDGNIDPWTNRNARATDTYILKGDGTEVYEPRFTYHGFRYVEVTGYPGTPTLDSVEGRVVHAAVESIGEFQTSNALLNQIHHNVRWSLRTNMMSIPTDTPVRDERTPPQMDVLSSQDAAIHNFQMNQFYEKYIDDTRGQRGHPDMHGQQVVGPWRLYQHYGNIRELERNYPNMKGYVDSLHASFPDHVIRGGFGDWCPPPPGEGQGGYDTRFSDEDLVNTALYYKIVNIVAKTASILGHEQDEKHYSELAGEIRSAFNREFANEDGTFGEKTQTSSILPLSFGLVPEDKRQLVSQKLVDIILKEHDGHLDTGIFGTQYLVNALADNGFIDVACDILTKTTYPSFGYQIERGATTLWEGWPERTGMQSHNHAMFAGVGTSFYTRLAGIEPATPGYKEIRIRPYIPKNLEFAEGSIETVYGVVASKWEQSQDGKLRLDVTVPVNTTASVYVPADSQWAVTVGHQFAHEAEGITFAGKEDGYAVFEVGSGSYQFNVEQLNAQDMRMLVERFKEEGEFTHDSVAHTLTLHLTAVSRYEENGEAEKVVKHMNGFILLLDYQKENAFISRAAYDTFKSHATAFIKKWNNLTK